jgi:hypothetical protein
MKFSEILFCLFLAIMVSASFFVGQYFGYKEGLYNGAIEYRTCMDNKATGWYVEGAEFNCIF